MIRCTEIFSRPIEYDPAIAMVKEGFSLREILLNPNHILLMKEDDTLRHKAQENELIEGLDRELHYTQVVLCAQHHTQTLTIIGNMREIAEKINGDN